MGATRWEVVRSHVLPDAAPGITGAILSMARAFGETAPLILVGAVTGFLRDRDRGLPRALHGRYTSLPTLIFAWSRRPARVADLTSAAILVLLV